MSLGVYQPVQPHGSVLAATTSRAWYCIPIRLRGGIYSQIYPFSRRSSRGRSPRELLKAKGYIWMYIPSWVLIRTVYHFNSHKANNSFIDNYSVYSPGKNTPRLEVILKELNISIPSFRMIYCIRIKTREEIYNQIYPSAWRSSRGRSPRELLKAEGYIWPYIPSQVLILTLYHFNNH